MRLLFVTPTDIDHPRGGRAMLARLHRDQLRALLGGNAADHILGDTGGRLQGLAGHLNGATPRGIATLLDAIDAHRAETLWLDGSNLGRVATAVRRHRPGTRVITFCHNVEARFFLGSLRHAPSVRALGVLIGNAVAERLAVRHSHDVVALSMRDSAMLARLYGRGASAILPMALTDQAMEPPPPGKLAATGAPLLFVGGAFYANRAGIAWYARHVAPRTSAVSTWVIGQGMEAMAASLEKAPGMKVIGAVDRLDSYYEMSRLIVAPIFDGSGMKTKVAEALMFGKRVIGTPEAFSGYADDVVAANRCCADVDAFVSAIDHAVAAAPPPVWDPVMRALYERDHSPTAVRARIAEILGIANSARGT